MDFSTGMRRNRMMIQQWHSIPCVLGFLLCTLPFLFCSSDGGDADAYSDGACAYPNSLSTTERNEYRWSDYALLLLGQVGYLCFALPWGWLGIACLLQIYDMDDRMLQELKPYKGDDGETVNGWLDEKTSNDTKSRFLIRYQYKNATIRKVIRLTNERDKQQLLSTPDKNDASSSSIPLIILLPNECSAVAQSWLEEMIQERTVMKRRWAHLGAAMYGIGLYVIIPLWNIFLVQDTRNACLLSGAFVLSIPAVHWNLLQRHEEFVQQYLNPPPNSSCRISHNNNNNNRAVYTGIPLAQIA
jgi:hypothetical protein